MFKGEVCLLVTCCLPREVNLFLVACYRCFHCLGLPEEKKSLSPEMGRGSQCCFGCLSVNRRVAFARFSFVFLWWNIGTTMGHKGKHEVTQSAPVCSLTSGSLLKYAIGLVSLCWGCLEREDCSFQSCQ